MRTWTFIGLAGLATLIFATAPDHATAAPPDAAEVATDIGFSKDDQQKAVKGQIVSTDLPETTKKMLAVAVGMVVPAKLDKVADFIIAQKTFDKGADNLGSGTIDPKNPEAGLAAAVFTPQENDEAARLGKAEPGDDFNLSADEFKAIRAAGSSPEAVSKAYQQILAARVRAYASQGLKGIAAYDRGGDIASASTDLFAMTKAADELNKYAPQLYNYLLNYPTALPPNITESFSWVKRKVEDRPAFVLVHHIVDRRPNGFVVVDREYYVGHSYNAAQTINAALQAKAGTVVFSLSRSTTDQVAGFMSGTRHAVGRSMLKEDVEGKFETLETALGK